MTSTLLHFATHCLAVIHTAYILYFVSVHVCEPKLSLFLGTWGYPKLSFHRKWSKALFSHINSCVKFSNSQNLTKWKKKKNDRSCCNTHQYYDEWWFISISVYLMPCADLVCVSHMHGASPLMTINLVSQFWPKKKWDHKFKSNCRWICYIRGFCLMVETSA